MTQSRGMSYFQMFFVSDDWVGQTIIAALAGLSLFVVAYTMRLALLIRHERLLPQASLTQLSHLLSTRQYVQAIAWARSDSSLLGQVMYAGLIEAGRGYDAMVAAMIDAADGELARLHRPVGYLHVIATVSPMVGLFGTVYGMIVAFEQLVAAGGRPGPGELAGGISTALVTTLWGLIVAIPAMMGDALLRSRIDALGQQSMQQAASLIRPFRPGAQQATPPA